MDSEIAVVTGASKGIGRQVAIKLAEEGMSVIGLGRSESDLRSLKKEAKDKDGKFDYYVTDLTDPHQLDELMKKLTSPDQKIRLLVHSAGIAHVGSVEKMPITKWRETIDTNLSVPFSFTQKCIPWLSNNAHIIYVNSVAGKETFADWSAYCASKWGLKALADSVRKELAPRGIKVTSVYPASVNTPMQDTIPYDWDRERMLSAKDVSEAIVNCFMQPDHVQINEIQLENISGTF